MIIEKTIHRGDTFCEILTFRDKATKEPIDLTQYSKIVADIREGVNSESNRIGRLTVLNGGLEISGDNNEVLSIHTETADWTKSKYYMDVRFVDENNKIVTYLSVNITVLNVITKIEDDE